MKDKITLLLILLFTVKITLKGHSITARNYSYLKKNTKTKEIKESELKYVDSLNIFFGLISSSLIFKTAFLKNFF